MKRKIPHLPENWWSKRKPTGISFGSGFIALLTLPANISVCVSFIAGIWTDDRGQALAFFIALGVSVIFLAPLIYHWVIGSERKVNVLAADLAVEALRERVTKGTSRAVPA